MSDDSGPVATIELTSLDGARITAHAARAAQPSGTGVVVLPGGRGLLRFYAQLADRFAAQGIDAIAIDPFCRSAGLGLRDMSFEWRKHIGQTTPEQTRDDVATALAYLRSAEGGSVRAAFLIGFSFGGAVAFVQSAEPHNLAGVIGMYGWPLGNQEQFPQWPAPIEVVSRARCPVLAIFAGDDEYIPGDASRSFDEALDTAGVEHWSVSVPGARHGFFAEPRQNPGAAEQAWRRTLAFMHALTPSERPTTVTEARSEAISTRRGEEEHFTGTVWLDELLAGQPSPSVYRVCFAPGARTYWHSHPSGQVLFVISGVGRVADRQGGRVIGPGDLVYAAAGEPHWHGAGPASPLVHLAVSLPRGGPTAWEGPVTDEEYARWFGRS